MEEYRTAVKYLEKAISLHTKESVDYVNLGHSYNELEDYPKAQEAFLKALKLDNENADAYDGLGTAYRNMGEKERAIDCYTKVIEFTKDKEKLFYAYLFRCTCNVSLQRTREALRDANKALEIKWDDGGSGDYQETRNSLMSLRDNLQRKLEG
jgi:tetratricopeptide (TPR) repeat protein